MDAKAIEQLRRLSEEGPRRFSEWNGPRFVGYCQDLLPRAWATLPPGGHRVFVGLATLIQQGVGEGYLSGDLEQSPRNFLEFCLRQWLPEVLASLPEGEGVALLSRIWNLGESLLREPEWVNAYVMSRIAAMAGTDSPEAFLVEVLRPLMEQAPAARWEAPYRVTLLSLRNDDDEFLPGEMQLVAPTVLVVTDRFRPARLGIHLLREGKSLVLGKFGLAGSFVEPLTAPTVHWEGGVARMGEDRVALPRPFSWTVVSAGFLVSSAVDSQKLWIVESAA